MYFFVVLGLQARRTPSRRSKNCSDNVWCDISYLWVKRRNLPISLHGKWVCCSPLRQLAASLFCCSPPLHTGVLETFCIIYFPVFSLLSCPCNVLFSLHRPINSTSAVCYLTSTGSISPPWTRMLDFQMRDDRISTSGHHLLLTDHRNDPFFPTACRHVDSSSRSLHDTDMLQCGFRRNYSA